MKSNSFNFFLPFEADNLSKASKAKGDDRYKNMIIRGIINPPIHTRMMRPITQPDRNLPNSSSIPSMISLTVPDRYKRHEFYSSTIPPVKMYTGIPIWAYLPGLIITMLLMEHPIRSQKNGIPLVGIICLLTTIGFG